VNKPLNNASVDPSIDVFDSALAIQGLNKPKKMINGEKYLSIFCHVFAIMKIIPNQFE
jgi:hypothetical protein